MVTTNVEQSILEAVKKAHNEEELYQVVFKNEADIIGENEFLMFIKPEALLPNDSVKSDKIIEFVLDRIKAFNLNIKQINVLSAKYLEKHNIIAQHYGVINKIANDAVGSMSDSAKEKFKKLYGKNIDDCKVLGGFEFLNQYSCFNGLSLDYLWQNKENQKLAGGTYCIKVKLDAEEVYIIDGFHPRQLEHFIDKGRCIVTLTLVGDTDWSKARQEFIGATNPTKAKEGSLRAEFLTKKDEFGLIEVSQGNNIVHLSAGAVEGLIELARYNTNFELTKEVDYSNFSFGNKLLDVFNQKAFDEIIKNIDVNIDGENISIFDLTEEKNAAKSVSLLKEHM